MDLLSQHEAFLRAIFDAPADDTPRLVYADFLQENGEEDRAEFIRASCEHKRLLNCDHDTPQRARLWDVINRQVELQRRLAATHPAAFNAYIVYDRGFPADAQREPFWVSTEDLIGATALRERAVFLQPSIFAVQSVEIKGQRITDSRPFDAFFALAAFARVSELFLRGRQEDVVSETEIEDGEHYLTEYVLKPCITTAGVVALAQHRGVRRIRSLDLRNNELDNDAARALVKSPYLDNLKRLDLFEGNRFRGKVWQQVIERFGEDVVG